MNTPYDDDTGPLPTVQPSPDPAYAAEVIMPDGESVIIPHRKPKRSWWLRTCQYFGYRL